MAGVGTDGDIASCLHENAGGSESVYANGKALSMVGVSTAGGGLIGMAEGGIVTVKANGSDVAVEGSPIGSHGDSPHAAAQTGAGSDTVFSG
mgnify:CR=1 FL=1|jgi:uncharacterized Zn-binding protein involved in type VI secretion